MMYCMYVCMYYYCVWVPYRWSFLSVLVYYFGRRRHAFVLCSRPLSLALCFLAGSGKAVSPPPVVKSVNQSISQSLTE